MKKRGNGRRSIKISDAAKILFPDVVLAKGELIDYYERIGDRIIPHVKDRPLVVQRFPHGIHEQGFYQKQVDGYYPDWIKTVRVDLVTADRTQELVVCDRKATLMYLADQACITFHPWLSRTDNVGDPDSVVIDLDPQGEDFKSVRRAALRVRDLLERERLRKDEDS